MQILCVSEAADYTGKSALAGLQAPARMHREKLAAGKTQQDRELAHDFSTNKV